MELRSEQRIALGRSEVWDALNDPEVLKQCIPLCDSFEKLSDTEFQFSMVAAIGPVRAKFKGKILYTNVEIPSSCSMTFQGQGGAAGFGNGEARVALVADGDATVLCYHVTAQVGGKLAQIGSRLVDAGARKIADDFFAKFNEVVAAARAQTPSVSDEPGAAQPAGAAPSDAALGAPARLKFLWIAAGLIAAGVLYWGYHRI